MCLLLSRGARWSLFGPASASKLRYHPLERAARLDDHWSYRSQNCRRKASERSAELGCGRQGWAGRGSCAGRRTALGWTLEQVAEQAQVSVGMLSLIETGKRRPSLRSWARIRGAIVGQRLGAPRGPSALAPATR